jgi:hypothetical protein
MIIGRDQGRMSEAEMQNDCFLGAQILVTCETRLKAVTITWPLGDDEGSEKLANSGPSTVTSRDRSRVSADFWTFDR